MKQYFTTLSDKRRLNSIMETIEMRGCGSLSKSWNSDGNLLCSQARFSDNSSFAKMRDVLEKINN
jgi:hypothetical protein